MTNTVTHPALSTLTAAADSARRLQGCCGVAFSIGHLVVVALDHSRDLRVENTATGEWFLASTAVVLDNLRALRLVPS